MCHGPNRVTVVSSPLKHECDMCDEGYENIEELREHIVEAHIERVNLICENENVMSESKEDNRDIDNNEDFVYCYNRKYLIFLST